MVLAPPNKKHRLEYPAMGEPTGMSSFPSATPAYGVPGWSVGVETAESVLLSPLQAKSAINENMNAILK